MRRWFLALSLALPGIAAATIHVPADYPTIQAAIDATFGEDILVAPGTYVENLNTHRKPITLRSEAGPAATIIDGSNPTDPDTASVICATASLFLQGFTITGGSGINRGSFYTSGGIHLVGGGTIRGNWITENHVTSPAAGQGGAIGIYDAGVPVQILENRIYSNSATSSAGAVLVGVNEVNLTDNFIYDNHVFTQTGGAVVNPGNSNGTHLRNVYACNSSTQRNGAIWGCREVRNCTFVSNVGTLGAVDLGLGKAYNSIFAFNVGGGIECGLPTGSCNAFFMNTPYDINGSCVLIGQNGNISVDPLFGDSDECDATFCLSPNSPLLPENSPPGCGLIGAVGACEVLAIDSATSPDFASGPLLAYPNPLNPQTVLSFLLPESRHVELAIFDAQGRVVRNLMSQTMTRGRHDVTWDGRDESGREVASGAYIAVLKSPSAHLSQKLLVLK